MSKSNMPAYNTRTALEQIERCEFACEGGPLVNNTAYIWLAEHMRKGPKFALGQWVWTTVEGEISGLKVSQTLRLAVVAIYMSSDSAGRTWTYALSDDPPAAYHYGSGVKLNAVAEAKLSEIEPAA